MVKEGKEPAQGLTARQDRLGTSGVHKRVGTEAFPKTMGHGSHFLNTYYVSNSVQAPYMH